MVKFHVEVTIPGLPMLIHAIEDGRLPATVAMLNVPKDFPFSPENLARNLNSILNGHAPLMMEERGHNRINYVRMSGGIELRASSDDNTMTRAGGAMISFTDRQNGEADYLELMQKRLSNAGMQLLCDATIGHKDRIIKLAAGPSAADQKGFTL